VCPGRGHDRDGSNLRFLGEHRLDRRESTAAVARGQDVGAPEVGVDDRPQVGLNELVVVPRVVPAHVPRADDGDRHG